MDAKKDQETRGGLKNTIRFHRGLNAVLAIALCSSIGLNYLVITRETIRIVPPVIQNNYSIGSSWASENYYRDMSNYILTTLFTVTPENIDSNIKIIMGMVDTQNYNEVQTSLIQASKRIKEQQITTIWNGGNVSFNKDAVTVTVDGSLRTYLGDKLVGTYPKTYRISYRLDQGKLNILKIEEIVANDQQQNQPQS